MLKNERKTIQKTIRTLLQQKETEKLNAQLEFIENIKDDSRKMFQAIKEINRQDSKRKLLIDGERTWPNIKPKATGNNHNIFPQRPVQQRCRKDPRNTNKRNENTIYTTRSRQRSQQI